MGGKKNKKGSKGSTPSGNPKKTPSSVSVPSKIEDEPIDDLDIPEEQTVPSDSEDAEVKKKPQAQASSLEEPPSLDTSESNSSLDPVLPEKQLSRKEMKKAKKKVN